MSEHSKFSASAASRWMACPGSVVLSKGLPNPSSTYAEEGTMAHLLLEWYLTPDGPPPPMAVSQEMDQAVNVALKNIREAAVDCDLLVAESRVNYANYLGVPEGDAFGTSDVIWLRDVTLGNRDYKHGRGVEVDAGHRDEKGRPHPNKQQALYSLGALNKYRDVADIERVHLAIDQPRIKSAPSEFEMTVQELEEWAAKVAKPAAQSVLVAEQTFKGLPDAEWEETFLHPGEDQCRWCLAKATCPALRAEVAKTVFGSVPATADEFDEFTPDTPDVMLQQQAPDEWLDAIYPKLPMIEGWMKSVLAEIERRSLAGTKFKHSKLVQGRMGDRAWSDKTAAEEMLKSMRLKVEEMYDLKLISPTTAEKLAAAKTIGPRQWKKAQELITRAPGKIHVAPISDKREAVDVTPAADDFETIEADASGGDFV